MPCLTLILGAGASRGVSYAHPGEFPSPLDCDFFDLLQRLKPQNKDRESVEFILQQVSELPPEFRRSMERSFYTLHLRSYLKRILSNPDNRSEEDYLLGCFAYATEALLRQSHGMQTCKHHQALVEKLCGNDAVISFNYDLVIDRALRPVAVSRGILFDSEIYRFVANAEYKLSIPKILKLHGSSHWRIRSGTLSTRIGEWKEFDDQAQYYRHSLEHGFPILLPFWDKDIEQGPWLPIWREAYLQLQRCDTVVVWGYSLPPTDVKARELFSIAIKDSGTAIKLCVIDPSAQARQRWRDLYPRAQFWEYHDVSEFLSRSPRWWTEYDARPNIETSNSCVDY